MIEQIPALVCAQCGEASIDHENAQKAYEIGEREVARGMSLEFCKFQAA